MEIGSRTLKRLCFSSSRVYQPVVTLMLSALAVLTAHCLIRKYKIPAMS